MLIEVDQKTALFVGKWQEPDPKGFTPEMENIPIFGVNTTYSIYYETPPYISSACMRKTWFLQKQLSNGPSHWILRGKLSRAFKSLKFLNSKVYAGLLFMLTAIKMSHGYGAVP